MLSRPPRPPRFGWARRGKTPNWCGSHDGFRESPASGPRGSPSHQGPANGRAALLAPTDLVLSPLPALEEVLPLARAAVRRPTSRPTAEVWEEALVFRSGRREWPRAGGLRVWGQMLNHVMNGVHAGVYGRGPEAGG